MYRYNTPKDGDLYCHVHTISCLLSEKIAHGFLDKQMDESLYRGNIHIEAC